MIFTRKDIERKEDTKIKINQQNKFNASRWKLFGTMMHKRIHCIEEIPNSTICFEFRNNFPIVQHVADKIWSIFLSICMGRTVDKYRIKWIRYEILLCLVKTTLNGQTRSAVDRWSCFGQRVSSFSAITAGFEETCGEKTSDPVSKYVLTSILYRKTAVETLSSLWNEKWKAMIPTTCTQRSIRPDLCKLNVTGAQRGW